MVCWLVEHQDVPVTDEKGCERHAASLPARELLDAPLPVEVGNESGEHLAGSRVSRPLVFRGVTHDGLSDVECRVKPVILAEHPHLHAAAHGYAPRIGLSLASKNAQQARFAGPVLTNDSGTVASV